jgi:hypothetical protein
MQQRNEEFMGKKTLKKTWFLILTDNLFICFLNVVAVTILIGYSRVCFFLF